MMDKEENKKLTYIEIEEISKQEAEKLFRTNDLDIIMHTLIRISYWVEDWEWVEDQCLKYMDHDDIWVKRAAITAIGHVARIHRNINEEVVIKKLQKYKNIDQLSGVIDDAEIDIEHWLHRVGKKS